MYLHFKPCITGPKRAGGGFGSVTQHDAAAFSPAGGPNVLPAPIAEPGPPTNGQAQQGAT